MNNKSLLEKIDFLFTVANKKKYTDKDLTDIIELAQEHSEHMILGRFMGYSVSDYAIATLGWLGTEETKTEYNKLFGGLSKARKQEVSELVDKKMYLQY